MVESAAANLAVKIQPNETRKFASPLKLKELLVKAGVLDRRQASAFDALRKIRNQVVHVPNVQFSDETISEYIESAEAMAKFISDRTERM